jgi:hypothetical protein
MAIENPKPASNRQQLTGWFTGMSRGIAERSRSTASFVHVRSIRTSLPRCMSIYTPATLVRRDGTTMRPLQKNLGYGESAYRSARIDLVYIKPRGSPNVPHNSTITVSPLQVNIQTTIMRFGKDSLSYLLSCILSTVCLAGCTNSLVQRNHNIGEQSRAAAATGGECSRLLRG